MDMRKVPVGLVLSVLALGVPVLAQTGGDPVTGAGEESPGGPEAKEADDGADQALDPQASVLDDFYSGLTPQNVGERIAAFYAPEVVYEDPFGRVDGREHLVEHYKKLFEGIQSLALEVKEEFVSGDETVAVWTLTMTHRSLGSGQPIEIDGVSHLRIDGGKLVGQRNYFDLGSLLYENAPFLGPIVRWVKRKAFD